MVCSSRRRGCTARLGIIRAMSQHLRRGIHGFGDGCMHVVLADEIQHPYATRDLVCLAV